MSFYSYTNDKKKNNRRVKYPICGEECSYKEEPIRCDSIQNILNLTQILKHEALKCRKHNPYDRGDSRMYDKCCILESELNHLVRSIRPVQNSYPVGSYFSHNLPLNSYSDSVEITPRYKKRKPRVDMTMIKTKRRLDVPFDSSLRKGRPQYFIDSKSSSYSSGEENVHYWTSSTPSEVSNGNEKGQLINFREKEQKKYNKKYGREKKSVKFGIHKSVPNLSRNGKQSVNKKTEVFLVKRKRNPSQSEEKPSKTSDRTKRTNKSQKERFFVSRLKKVNSVSSTSSNSKSKTKPQEYKSEVDNKFNKNLLGNNTQKKINVSDSESSSSNISIRKNQIKNTKYQKEKTSASKSDSLDSNKEINTTTKYDKETTLVANASSIFQSPFVRSLSSDTNKINGHNFSFNKSYEIVGKRKPNTQTQKPDWSNSSKQIHKRDSSTTNSTYEIVNSYKNSVDYEEINALKYEKPPNTVSNSLNGMKNKIFDRVNLEKHNKDGKRFIAREGDRSYLSITSKPNKKVFYASNDGDRTQKVLRAGGSKTSGNRKQCDKSKVQSGNRQPKVYEITPVQSFTKNSSSLVTKSQKKYLDSSPDVRLNVYQYSFKNKDTLPHNEVPLENSDSEEIIQAISPLKLSDDSGYSEANFTRKRNSPASSLKTNNNENDGSFYRTENPASTHWPLSKTKTGDKETHSRESYQSSKEKHTEDAKELKQTSSWKRFKNRMKVTKKLKKAKSPEENETVETMSGASIAKKPNALRRMFSKAKQPKQVESEETLANEPRSVSGYFDDLSLTSQSHVEKRKKPNILKRVFSKSKQTNRDDSNESIVGSRSEYHDNLSQKSASTSQVEKRKKPHGLMKMFSKGKKPKRQESKETVIKPPMTSKEVTEKPKNKCDKTSGLNYSLCYSRERRRCVGMDSVPSTLTLAEALPPNCKPLWSTDKTCLSEHAFDDPEKHYKLNEFYVNPKMCNEGRSRNKPLYRKQQTQTKEKNLSNQEKDVFNDGPNKHNKAAPAYFKKIPISVSDQLLSDSSSCVSWRRVASEIRDAKNV